MKITTDEKKIQELLTRGVGEFIDPDGAFRKKLESNPEKIVIKLGADPTRPDLHLGHAVILRKLRQFQDLGCKIIFIVGDFTTLFGDPTGKSKIRPKFSLNEEVDKTATGFKKSDYKTSNEHTEYTPTEIPSSIEIAKNMETYIEQVKKILLTDETHFAWIKNSDWFLGPTDLNFSKESRSGLKIDFMKEGEQKSISVNFDVNTLIGKSLLYETTRMQTRVNKNNLTLITSRGLLWTLQHITHSRLIERDMFQERIKNREELYMHEMLYPVLQGIDSFALYKIYGGCDLEVGGTDQTFNMLMGRDVLKANKLQPQAVLSFKLLEGTDGKEKMSKSLDNYIAITDEPNDMYGKVMSIPDSSIGNYFELCTFTPTEEVEEIKKKLKKASVNPKDIKMNLARQIVSIYHGETKAGKAEENFEKTFAKGGIPDDVKEIKNEGRSLDVLVMSGVKSTSEAQRLFDAGAVIDVTENKKLTSKDKLKSGHVLKIGKHRFIKIK